MTYAENCLEGKVILITGGMGAIGKVVVGRLLAHSARVVINDLISAQETQKFAIEAQWPADRFFYIQSDITRRAECQELVSSAFKRFQRLDITLCHAGMAQSCPILEYSEADWDRILNLNLKSAFMVAQASAQAMIQQGIKGKIIFTSSWVQDVPWPNITPYNVSKSGMKMLMRGMARELAPHGIRVNSIAPGIWRSVWLNASGIRSRIIDDGRRRPFRWGICSPPNQERMPSYSFTRMPPITSRERRCW